MSGERKDERTIPVFDAAVVTRTHKSAESRLDDALGQASQVLLLLGSSVRRGDNSRTAKYLRELVAKTADNLREAVFQYRAYWQWQLYFGPAQPDRELPAIRKAPRPRCPIPPREWFGNHVQSGDEHEFDAQRVALAAEEPGKYESKAKKAPPKRRKPRG